MSSLVVQHIVTQRELVRIVSFFKRPAHRNFGYYFEVDELGVTMRDAVLMEGLSVYSTSPEKVSSISSWWKQPAFLLRVYRDKTPAMTVPSPPPEKLTPDELRVLKKFAQHLLEIERSGGVVLD